MRRKLKSLIVSGRNHIWNKQYLLSDAYKAGLEWLLERLHPPSLRHLEILTDESRRSVDIVRKCFRYYQVDILARHCMKLSGPAVHNNY